METTNAVTLERMEGVIRWINGQDTQMQESEVRTAINDLIKSFRMKFRELHPAQDLPRLRTLSIHPLSLAALLGDSVTETPGEKDKEMKDEKVRKAEIMRKRRMRRKWKRESRKRKGLKAVHRVNLRTVRPMTA